MFLFTTAVHSFATLFISMSLAGKIKDHFNKTLCMWLGLYTGIIGLLLLIFAASSLSMAVQNTTMNEDLRGKWNSQ